MYTPPVFRHTVVSAVFELYMVFNDNIALVGDSLHKSSTSIESFNFLVVFPDPSLDKTKVSLLVDMSYRKWLHVAVF